MSPCTLRTPQPSEWLAIARLIAAAIPNYLVSQLGPRFGACYYRQIADHPEACALAAYASNGELVGFILGTCDRQTMQRLRLPIMIKLLAAANLWLLSPAALGWLCRGVRERIGSDRHRLPSPSAELIVFVVTPAFRGEGLAPRLLGEMESFFTRQQLQNPYLILTETTNLAANRFYRKIGAQFIRTNLHHGRAINEWHKTIANLPAGESSAASRKQPVAPVKAQPSSPERSTDFSLGRPSCYANDLPDHSACY